MLTADEIVREALAIVQGGASTLSYPYMLVGTVDGFEIVEPGELVAMSDDDLRARWDRYDTPDKLGLVSHIWSCRGYARLISTLKPIWIPLAWPTSPQIEHGLIMLFWPPRKSGGAVEYITHYGSEESAIEGLYWLVTQDMQPFTGRRCTTEYDNHLQPFTVDTFTDNLMDD